MLIASLIGLFASVYLLYTYISGAPIVCGLVSGCELVRASKWAYTFGLPRPLLGVVFYAGVIGLLIIRSVTAWRSSLLRRLTFLAAILGFIESAFLFIIQWLDVKAFCLWCLVSGAVATILFIFSFFDRAEVFDSAQRQSEVRWYLYALVAFVILGLPVLARLIGVI